MRIIFVISFFIVVIFSFLLQYRTCLLTFPLLGFVHLCPAFVDPVVTSLFQEHTFQYRFHRRREKYEEEAASHRASILLH